MSCINSEYLALATVIALLFPVHHAAVDKEIDSIVHANQRMKQITTATESPLPICSICLIARETKRIKIKKKEEGEEGTFHNHVTQTGIIASTNRLIFKYTWVRNNSTAQSSCGHTVYFPF